MSISWENARKQLIELQESTPKPLLIELTYKDKTKEVLTLNEVLERDNTEYWSFQVVEGGKLTEARKLLEWIAPDTAIK